MIPFLTYKKTALFIGDMLGTILAGIAVMSISEIVSLVAGVFMVMYWPFRIRREINTYHNGSFKQYIKYIFKKNARKDN